MTARSLLFVPGDSERKLAKGESAGADILILDLEDAVVPEQKTAARIRVREYLSAHRDRTKTQLWVRINPLDTPEALDDLATVVAAAPDGIMQPKTRSADDVIRLGHYLDALEKAYALAPGHIRILPVATETPEAIFSLGGFTHCGPRLYGITWGAEDLSAAIGGTGNKQADGRWTQPYQLARSLCLFAAGAAKVAAIDTLFVDFRDDAGLRAACAEGRRDGFTGKVAIHPDQVAAINECFVPSAQEIEHATRLIALFRDNAGVAALQLDGQMVDIPHLRQAEKTLARAGIKPT
jgi:citrate lyase subunit beta/citryl-CoA lyase